MSLVAAAKPVSPFLAAEVAGAFFPNTELMVSEIGYNQYIYLIKPVDGNGFVLVAADDCVRPVLAWSPTGSFPVDNMPQHVRAWIDGYAREIEAFMQAGAVPSRGVAAEWEMFLGGREKNGVVVEPLLTTRWNQAPYFNALCPFDVNDSALCVTGCTATATAQVMKYWNHPEVGWGSHSYFHQNYGLLEAQFDTTYYRWTMMPDTLNALCTSDEINAVAELMYHVGVAVDMNYSPSGSGAAVNSYGYSNYPSAENALKTYFKYNPMLRSEFKAEHTDVEWDSLLRVEIDAARPVLYAGYDSAGGHAFVLDGYDSLGMFHVNWGWGGHYDGYYTTDSLSPGAGGIGGNATYTFNISNSAVVGITPATHDGDSIATISVVSADLNMGTVDGSGTYELYTPVNVVARANEGYRFVRWTSGNISNPFSFLASADIVDTAIFEQIYGDTLGYCFDAMRSSWRDDYGDTTEWGIRIPASMHIPGRMLTAVQFYVYQPVVMTMNIYRGGTVSEFNLVYSQLLDLATMPGGWNQIELDDPVIASATEPLWITFRCIDGSHYPAAFGRYTGNTDGTWYRLPDGWRRYDQYGEFLTWMIRGVFEPSPVVTINVLPIDENHCTVYGGGQYHLGEQAQIGAIVLASNCQFDHWSDGSTSNPYTFEVSMERTLWARCTCDGAGIDDPDGEPFSVAIDGRSVSIDCPADEQPVCYDIQGRRIATGRTFEVPATGVYVIKLNGRKPVKITVLL